MTLPMSGTGARSRSAPRPRGEPEGFLPPPPPRWRLDQGPDPLEMTCEELDHMVLLMSERDFAQIQVLSELPKSETEERKAIWISLGGRKYLAKWMAKGASRDVYELGTYYVLKHMFWYREGESKANPNRKEIDMCQQYRDYFPRASMVSKTLMVASRASFSLERLLQQGDRVNHLDPQRRGKKDHYRESDEARLVVLPAEPQFLAEALSKFLSWVAHFIRFCREERVLPQDFQPTNDLRRTWVVIDAGSFRFPNSASPSGGRSLKDIARVIEAGLTAGEKDTKGGRILPC